MGIVNNVLAGASGQAGYNLTRSLRFRSSASAYLSRTPASAGNRKTWTYSTWVKKSAISAYQRILEVGSSNADRTVIGFQNTDVLEFFNTISSSSSALVTTQVFRDPSAWYHIVVVMDTTQATASNRTKIYVNGVQVTSFGTSNYVSQNTDTYVNSTVIHRIAANNGNGDTLDGYLTEVNFIDGQALTPSSFGQTSSSTGVWQPKKYSGTYGTNGFYLPFTDNSALTSGSNAGLGKDFSGNGNYWNTNNISITSGSTYDSMTDVPTLTSATVANFCTLNPIFDPNYLASTNQSNVTMSGGNLNYGTGGRNGFGTIAPSSGKYYWEMSNTSNTSASVVVTGVVTIDARSSIYGVYYNSSNGNKGQGFLASGATETSYGSTWTDNDIIGVALDCDTNTVTFYKNNVSQGAITNSNLAGKQIVAWMQSGNNVNSMTGWFNFGQRPFAYTPPTGYVALNTYNLPTPTIGATASSQANKYFDVSLYTGNGSSQSVTNSGSMQPDFLWIKNRTTAGDYHNLFNAVVGASKYLASNSTDAEASNNNLTSFNSNGFTVPSANDTNRSGSSFVGWQWKANGSGSSNTAGSITSTVSANTTSGFSIVTWTGNGGSGSIGHGLGVAPAMYIVKGRSGTNNWTSYHQSLGATKYITLNTTDAATTSSAAWGNNAPTSSVFYVDAVGFGNTATYVTYCFAEVAGFSKFGSYTGNDSADGPFVYCGFRPKYLMIKNASAAQPWVVIDTARSAYNVSANKLYPNASDAENSTSTDNSLDILSNGFKLRGDPSTNDATNGPSNTLIYMAFAENPFKYSLAR